MADLTITPASVIAGADAVKNGGIAGETILAGQAVYLKAADSRLWLALATTAAAATAVGIALHAALAGQPLVYIEGGSLVIGATTSKATTYMVSAAAGGICPQADLVSTNKISYLGYATDTTGTFVLHKKLTGAAV